MAINPVKCKRLRTALPLESGNIQGMTEKAIAESADYLLTHIPQGNYATGQGIDPYFTRWGVPPIAETAYYDPRGTPNLGTNNGLMEARGQDGQPRTETVNVNGQGALGCAMPSTEIGSMGFDTFFRDMRANKWTIGPLCAWDFLDYAEPQIAALRTALYERYPQMLKDNFEYELRRRVITSSLYNYSVIAGMPHSAAGFPAIPTGQLDLGVVRRIINGPMKAHGWTGMPEVSVSEEAFETMRANYKTFKALTLESTLDSSETHYIGDVRTIIWGGVKWVINPEPMRGYFIPAPAGGVTFIPVYPRTYREGTGGGLVDDYNSGYDDPYIFVDGQRHQMYEVSMAVHSTAFERQAMAMPAMLGKSWSKNLFNFEVEVLDRNNGGLIDCNEDNMKWAWAIRHVYGWQPKNPERAFAIVHQVAPNAINIVSANTLFPPGDWTAGPGASAAAVEVAEPAPNGSGPCVDDEMIITCPAFDEDNLVPNVLEPLPDGATTPNVGKYFFAGGTPVGAQKNTIVQIPVTRVDGVLGATSITITPTAGTATSGAGNDFLLGATTLNWADGEGGTKYAPVTVLATATTGQSFTMVATGALTSDDGVTAVTVTII